MAEITSREDKPVTGIEYSQINIPDEENLGTGTVTIALEPEALKIVPLVSTIINEPVFQFIANINYEDDEITVLLGKADNTPPLSREVFVLPKKIDVKETHQLVVVFTDWKITEVKMNEDNMEKVSG